MIRDKRPLLSRVADSVYWMARYIERAENVARFIGVNLHLQLDLPLAPAHQWQPLIDTAGDTEVFKEKCGEATEENVIHFLAFDDQNPNSIFSCLRFARENARSVRETISSEMWEQINSMYLQIQLHRATPQQDSLPEVLRSIRLSCHMFQGITEATMRHDEAWHFLRLGRMMERADKTSRILDVKYFILLPSPVNVGTPYDDLHWAAVLKSVSGFETYRKQRGRIAPRQIVEFLVTDPEFPRAIRHCVDVASESLSVITGTLASPSRYSSERLMDVLRTELGEVRVEAVVRSGLHEYLDGLQTKMNLIGDSLRQDFFALRSKERTTNSSSQWQKSEGAPA
jgi:uncharacterized alpha-E superfamily protein